MGFFGKRRSVLGLFFFKFFCKKDKDQKSGSQMEKTCYFFFPPHKMKRDAGKINP